MTVKPVALILTVLVLISRLIVSDYDEADSKLNSFYLEMLNADVSAARRSIDEAIRLWAWNSKYHAWRGYILSQELPSHCPRGFHGVFSALNSPDQQNARDALTDYRRGFLDSGLVRRIVRPSSSAFPIRSAAREMALQKRKFE
jgi:hypothetical protein